MNVRMSNVPSPLQLIGCFLTALICGCGVADSTGRTTAERALDNPNTGDATEEPATGEDAGLEPMDEDSCDTDPLDQVPEDDLLEGTPNAEHLATLTLAHLSVGGQVFLVWVADDYAERQRGLMHVTAEEMEPPPDPCVADRRGMLFVFEHDTTIGFWMRNTIIPLDVAYIRTDGTIDSMRTMAPLVESGYPPDGPYRYALEVNAGTLAELGVQPGDRVELPEL